MNVLISGGTGFIGRALSKRLLAEGDRVTVLSRSPEKAQVLEGVQVEPWDGLTLGAWADRIDETDAVLNLAGENIGTIPWSPARKQQIIDSRVKTGKLLVEAIRLAGRKPAVLLQPSAIGHYGFSFDRTMTEKSPPGNDFLARVTLLWEGATQGVEVLGVRRVVTRSGLILDRREGVLPRMLLPFRLFVGGRVGSGRQWYSWIHIQDEVDAMLVLLKNDMARGPYNLTAPNPVTNAEFARTLGRVVGRPAWLPTPAFGLKAVLGEMSSLVLTGQRVIPERLSGLGFKYRFETLEPALRDLFR
jgi:uncharacterized protein (TIGR01777 family)